MVKQTVLAAVFVLAVASATAQEAPPGTRQVGADAAASEPASGISGFRTSSTELGWVWYRPQRTWLYYTGSVWALWMDMRNSSDTITATLGSNPGEAAANQMNTATQWSNWLGAYYATSTSITAVQLWWY